MLYLYDLNALTYLTMQVFVNDKCIVIFKGAKIKDAVARYCIKMNLSPEESRGASIRDAQGHTVGEDALIAESQQIFVEI